MSADPRAPVVVMGVSGAGKTTLAQALAVRLGRPFLEGDRLHPPENVAKMTRGEPLDDHDREPWLDAVAHALVQQPDAVVSCSALRRRYRDRLRLVAPHLVVVHVTAPREVLQARVAGRAGHWMPPSLLASQLATLEPLQADERGLTVDGTRPLDVTVEEVVARLRP